MADAHGTIVVDSREGAQEQTADVGEGGGAASGDAIAGDQIVELVEREVDGLRALETIGALHEREEKVAVFVDGLFLGEVVGAETGLGVRGEETALVSAGGKAMGAASFWCNGCNGYLRHGVWCAFLSK